MPSIDLEYEYWNNGTLKNKMFGSYLMESYYYKANKTLETIVANHLGQSGKWDFERDAADKVTKIKFPNKTRTDLNYDQASRLSGIDFRNTSGTINSSLSYTLDPNSNITGIQENQNNTIYTHSYVLDAENRITQASSYEAELFNMDLLGNITTDGGIFNSINQLTEDSENFYTYTINGNRERVTAKFGSKVTEFFWSVENQLVRATIKEDGVNIAIQIDYKYDGLNRRIERIVTNNIEPQKSYHQKFLYDGSDILAELDENNNVRATYVNGPGIDNVLAMTRDSNKNQQIDNGELYFFNKDHLNSTKEITKQDGTVVQSYKYSTYGKQTVEVTPGQTEVENTRTYTGREHEKELGIRFNRTRYLDPKIKMFLSLDTIGFAGGDPNLLRYVGNNPVSNIDPTGKFLAPILNPNPTGSLGAIIGGVIGSGLGGIPGAIIGGIIGNGIGNFIGTIIDPSSGTAGLGSDVVPVNAPAPLSNVIIAPIDSSSLINNMNLPPQNSCVAP